ncbi:NYN domain-containing protein [Microbacterium sp. B2969]|uniref:NYN domain-containing protein n=1 Tax=Microbacterium alkaliflavum TaxID=3248839 RepID=A0ABW7Q3J1_9MICO
MTWVLVDGENIDATLGTSILNRRPQPDERPRWDRLVAFAERVWGQPARGVFYLNASTGIPMPFVQALKAMEYVVVPLSGAPDEKVVDIAIQRTLRALDGRAADLMLVSHDGDFLPDISSLIGPPRRVGVVAFAEFRNAGFNSLTGLEKFDLEYDARVFDAPLSRVRVIPIDEFDPNTFLG